MEQALKQSQRYNEDLLNSTTDIAILIDLDGTILEMNRLGLEIYEFLGFKDLIGSSLYRLYPPDRVERVKRGLSRIIENKKPRRVELRFEQLFFDMFIISRTSRQLL